MGNFWSEALHQGFHKILGPKARFFPGREEPSSEVPSSTWDRRWSDEVPEGWTPGHRGEMLGTRENLPRVEVDLGDESLWDKAQKLGTSPEEAAANRAAIAAPFKKAAGWVSSKLDNVSLPLSPQGRAELEGFKKGMSRAYGPLFGGGTPASDADGIAAGMELPGVKTKHTFGAEPDTSMGLPSADAQMEGLQISNMLDLKRLGSDMEKARAGDPEAKKRVAAAASSPGLTSPGKKKAPEMGGPLLSEIKGLDALPTRDMTGAGLSASVLPGAKDLTSKTFDAQPGGGGVEVPEQEQPKFDRAMGLGVVGDTLINLGNAIGNGRPMATGGYLEQMMQQRQQEQMQQLKMRHDLWADTYKQSQELPGEVLTLPEFAGLAQAKAILDKDMADGKIDNEKSVSNFLMEQAKAKVALNDLRLTNLAKDQDVVAGKQEEFAASRRADLEKRAAEGNPTAKAALDLAGPSKMQIYLEEKARREADDKRLAQQTQWAHEDRQAAIEANRAYKDATSQARQDTLDFNRRRQAAAGLNAMMRDTLKMYGKPDEDGNLTNPEEAMNSVFKIHGDDIMYTAEQLGIRVQKAGDAQTPLLVINGRPMNVRQGQQMLLAMIRTAGGE